ncbi:oligosaccharide flippase family protein [Methylomonas sp. BW4-1]|uniref:oligosaccharide flippase family protein n=1 Tax=Methylomonas sp. BW4-1 TaxID=3376685 RepID=UPI0040422059
MQHKFARNSIFNFMGAATPALANLIAVPVLVNSLGDANYGLLSLVLAVVGYFGLLDISATQGSTRFIAEYDSLGQPRQANEVISFGLIIYLVIGLCGMTLIYFGAPLLIKNVFEIPAENIDTALATLKLAAVAFLFSQVQSYLISVPQAMQRYAISATTEAIFGSAAPIISMGVALLTGSIEDVVAARLGLSVINVGVLSICILRIRPDFKISKAGKSIRRRLLSFSAFSYLSTITGISYAQSDRLILGILLGLGEITLYTVPTTLVNRLFGMTYRLGSVIYPAASKLAALGDRDGVRSVYLLTSRYMTAINSLLILMLTVYGQDLLNLWVGPQFVEQGYPVLVIIALGIFIDSMTNLPSLVNNAIGHPKTTGLFAVARAVFGIGALIVGTQKGGIIGTALSHLVASVLATSAFMFYVHGRSVPASLFELIRKAYIPVLLVAVFTFSAAWFTKPVYPAHFFDLLIHGLLILALYILSAVFFILTPEHKQTVFIRLSIR